MRLLATALLAMLAGVIIGGAAIGSPMGADVVQAAPAEPVEPCLAVATAGNIIVYFCETDYGDFFINSMGFMVVAP